MDFQDIHLLKSIFTLMNNNTAQEVYNLQEARNELPKRGSKQ